MDDTVVKAPDWVLTSLAPFNSQETLDITMRNGDVITVDVTDDQDLNLADFLTDATLQIDGKTYGKGDVWKVRQGQDYTLKLTFKENGSHQFPQGGGEMVMDPEDLGGMDLQPGQTGSFDIPMGLYGTVTGNSWWVDADGKLHIKFGNDPDNLLTRSNNAYFNLEMNVKFSGEKGQPIKFSDTVERTWEPNTDTDVKATKSGHYDSATGKMVYTVKVTSTGNSKNVKVEDALSNTNLLKLDQDSIKISPAKELDTSKSVTTSSGFTRVIKEMAHGETVTITYTADVDESKLGENGKVTGDDGKNHVKVTNGDGKTDEKDNVVNEIKYSDLSKVSTASTDKGTTVEMEWKITANASMKASLVGGTISDRIDWNSKDVMKYADSGGNLTLQVVGTDASGESYTKNVTVNIADNQGQQSWSWKVESLGETAGTPLKYEITYKTNVTKQANDVTVKNNATTDRGGSDTGAGVVPGTNPGGGSGEGGGGSSIVAAKTATNVTAEYIDWNIVINVPEEGFPDGLTVTDFIPREQGSYNGANGFADRLVGEPTVTGLEGTETFSCSVAEDFSAHYTRDGSDYATQTLTIDFYKDAAKSQKGIGAGPRTITISLRTANDQKWVDYAATRGGGDPAYYHKNKGKVNSKDIEAYGIPLKPAVDKQLRSTSKKDGLPVYEYMVTLSNVTDVPVVLEDAFDTDYLEFYRVGIDSWDALDYIAAAEQTNNLNGGVPGYKIEVTPTSSGISITAADLPKKKDGSFYEYYRVYYSLKVKDADALKKLEEAAIANGGKYTLKNVATWGDLSDDAEVDYEVKPLSKSGFFAQDGAEARLFTYVIDVNPNRYKLSTDDTLTLNDQHSDNLSVDYSSVTIYKIPDNVSIGDAKTAAQQKRLKDEWKCAPGTIPWNFNGNEGTFTLPDETHYVIVYDAIVVGTGKQVFQNTADLNGYISSSKETKEYSSDVVGGGEVWEIKLLKYQNGQTSNGLQGAVFQLFRGTGEYTEVTDDEGNTWYEEIKEPMKYGDTETTRRNGTVGQDVTFQTAADGTVDIKLNQTDDGNEIEGGVRYYLKEVDSPAGYQIDSSTEYWEFSLTNDPDEVNYGDPDRRDDYGNRQWVYFYYKDIMKVANTEAEEPLDVSVHKQWFDENGNQITGDDLGAGYVAQAQLYRKTDDGEYKPVKVEMDADGKVTSITELDDTDTSGRVDLNLANKWAYTWEDLPRVERGGDKGFDVLHRYAYKVEEVPLEGYVSVVDEEESETEKAYTLKNYKKPTDRTTELTVNKTWLDTEGAEITGEAANKLPDHIDFRLYRAVSTTPFTHVPTSGGSLYVAAGDSHLVKPDASTADDDYAVYRITAAENWTATLSGLPEVETKDGTTFYYAYYVKELPVEGYYATYTVDGSTRTIANHENLPEGKYINIGLEKKWKAGDTTTPPSGAQATFTVRQQVSKATVGGSKSDSYTMVLKDSGGNKLSEIEAIAGDELSLAFDLSADAYISIYQLDKYNKSEYGYYGQIYKNGNSSGSITYKVSSGDDKDGDHVIEFKLAQKYDNDTKFVTPEMFATLPSWVNTSEPVVQYGGWEDTSYTRTITLPTTTGQWSTTIKDLVQEDADGNLYRYYITEDSCTPKADSTAFKDDLGKDIEHAIDTNGKKAVVTNTYEPQYGSVKVMKKFEGIQASEIPESFKIFATWNEGGKTKSCELTLRGDTASGVTRASSGLEYTWTIGNLPLGTVVSFSEEGYEVDGKTVQVTLDPESAKSGEGTLKASATADPESVKFTNTYASIPPVDVAIKKVDDNGKALDGAVFELYRKNNQSYEIITNQLCSSVDAQGRFTVYAAGTTLVGLADGAYQLKEVSAPAGYVITNETPVTFTIENGVVVEGKNALSSGVSYTKKNGSTADTFTIPNKPGTPLPNTGGSGTDALYLLGLIMALSSAALLLIRRGRRA